MTRAREWWQEKMRYAAETSTTQPSGVGCRSRLLITSVALLSALTIVTYASRRSNPVPNPVIEPPLKGPCYVGPGEEAKLHSKGYR
jgi:hypothetical protein